MGLLDKILADDAIAAADPDGFGEAGIYTPRAGQPIDPCNAIVFRYFPEATVQSPDHGNRFRIEIEIPCDPLGVKGPSAVDPNGDTFTIAKRIGGAPEALSVTKVLRQGGGFWRLSLT